jgi:U4/U6 small nuclear ribonucleoprotein PRP31
MSFLAPNLTIILGSAVAARLIGVSGGLTALSRIPSCNILVLGAGKKANIGLSSVYMGKHAGVIYECDMIKNSPSDIKRKAARMIAAKYLSK